MEHARLSLPLDDTHSGSRGRLSDGNRTEGILESCLSKHHALVVRTTYAIHIMHLVCALSVYESTQYPPSVGRHAYLFTWNTHRDTGHMHSHRRRRRLRPAHEHDPLAAGQAAYAQPPGSLGPSPPIMHVVVAKLLLLLLMLPLLLPSLRRELLLAAAAPLPGRHYHPPEEEGLLHLSIWPSMH